MNLKTALKQLNIAEDYFEAIHPGWESSMKQLPDNCISVYNKTDLVKFAEINA